ncbi:MAG: hypothetical protein A3G34_06070 [Candidatus Lindowbacteria bacterium RIFCSPLOWO2_12_FULL_62_27]|nr:MAG: hypothetical protein A3G34_06070 [Candidatus Lindowbacteria bacterium RIFCSPLOWO2_12_FULL_62_27]OGH57478.1 MAG: hypothetical protein A3I06_06420 [Candidatus Lindowbacteria bacterium RIFCSPLOWO2_02_FULL_62_12]
MQETELKYRTLFEQSQAGVLLIDAETHRLVLFNDAACQQLGYTREEFSQLKISDFEAAETPDETVRHVDRIVLQGQDLFRTRHRTKTGEMRDVIVKANAIRLDGRTLFHCIFQDVTDMKRKEEELQKVREQLLQAQKMEAVGRLAGGVAHDFNNLLTAIISYCELLRKTMSPDDPRIRDIDEIRKASLHGAELIRKLLAFTRRQVLTPVVLDLNGLIRDMERLLGRLIGEDIALRLDLEPGMGLIRIDPVSFEQVVMNLAVNARDAMTAGGKLTIQSRARRIDSPLCLRDDTLAPAAYAVLTVQDTGTGMDEHVLEHLFEPFFTTKHPGTGTGLGLSTVYGIVKQSGGAISVESAPGKGTLFSIYLPLVDEPERAAPARSTRRAAGGSETVLLVEDEDRVRTVVRQMLESNGFKVLEAAGGGEAFVVSQQHAAPIDLMLTDVVMPRMSGVELADRLAPLRPDMKVLFMSGYLDDALARFGEKTMQERFIQKPFTEAGLLRRIRATLTAVPPEGARAP